VAAATTARATIAAGPRRTPVRRRFPTPAGTVPAVDRRRIVAMGGGGFSMEPENPLLDEFVLSLARRARPRVCFVATASGDADGYVASFYRAFAALDCRPSDLGLFDRRVGDLRAFVLEQDVVYVGGGNTASLLAVWRAHGLDAVLAEAWAAGVVLCGISAGMNCWFRQSVTDSFDVATLAPLLDGLGLLAGSACPHYDGEEQRRPTYRRLVGPGCSRTAGRPTTARRSCSKAKRSPRSSPRGRRRRRTASRATATVSARSACRRATSAAADRAAQPTPAGWSRRSISISPSSRSTSRGSMSPAPRRCVDSAPHATAKRRHSAGGVPR
jgi:dipeptidase E